MKIPSFCALKQQVKCVLFRLGIVLPEDVWYDLQRHVFGQFCVPTGCEKAQLQIAALSVPSTPFMYVENAFGNLDWTWPSDAILGLSPDEESEYAVISIAHVLSQLPQNIVTVYYARLGSCGTRCRAKYAEISSFQRNSQRSRKRTAHDRRRRQ